MEIVRKVSEGRGREGQRGKSKEAVRMLEEERLEREEIISRI